LKAILSIYVGYYGTLTNDSPFLVHAATANHYFHGSYFPIGGSKVIAEGLLGRVIENGGNVIVEAEAEKLIFYDGKICGVRLKSGENFYADRVVSAMGVKNSLKILP